MKSKNMSISFRNEPEPPDWVVDIFQHVSRSVENMDESIRYQKERQRENNEWTAF
jgi:hypothetical protein